MLLFSKKARPVEFKPCTLKEYRETKPFAYMELGKLQPDLNTEELVAKVVDYLAPQRPVRRFTSFLFPAMIKANATQAHLLSWTVTAKTA